MAVRQKRNRLIPPKTEHLKPWQFKKGQSGNPAGRTPGKTLKDYARELLACQSEEERQAYLEGIDKELIWKMAEGAPDTKGDLSLKTTLTISFDPTFGATPRQTETDSPK